MSRTRFFPKWRAIIGYLRNPKTDWKPKVLFALALLYLIIPIDLLPDFAPIIGWLDDLGFTTLAALYLLRASKSYENQIKK